MPPRARWVQTNVLDAFTRLSETTDTPMFVVTAASGGVRAGCLVGFATQCSIEPRRYLVCVSKTNRSFDVAQRARRLVVHVLRDGDLPLARLFGEETGRDIDKFARCRWHLTADGTPVLDDCDWFAGTIVERVDLGDHVGFVLDVPGEGTTTRTDRAQLGYQHVKDLQAGNPP
jgi:flavin reductase (DIM6/NTAB) family NADH-FMN oxidoreductase RutF